MSDTAPIRRPARSVQSRRRSASRRAVDEGGGYRREAFEHDQPMRGSSVGGFFNAISQYGVNKMTTNIHAGDMRKRISAMFMVILLVVSLVYLRVLSLQTFKSADLKAESIAQRVRTNEIRASRGTILDRDGLELAIPVPSRTIFADPREVTDPVTTARALATVLQMTPDEEMNLAQRLQNKNSSFTYVVRQVDSELAKTIADLKLVGISSISEEGRVLTSEGLRPVIGRVDIDGVGIGGLELQYNEALTGTPGKTSREVNSRGQNIASARNEYVAPIPGSSLVTSIHRTLQFQVDSILQQQVERLMARSGIAVVMHTKSGEIYAMSSVRRNEDGTYSNNAGNLAAVEAHEPGSVAKVFSVAAAIEDGMVTPQTSFLVQGKQVFNQGTQWEQEIKDAYPHPTEQMSVRKILVDSSNLGTIQISQTLSTERNRQWLSAFGFGEKTSLKFPGETKGLLKLARNWQGTEKFTFAYGYGYGATPIQLVSAVNVIANDGVYIGPKLVTQVVDDRGLSTPTPESPTRRVLSSSTAATMRSLMNDVVCYGTAQLAKMKGLSVGGKTGTGYIRQDNGTYLKDDGSRAYFASFVGFLPASNPEFTVLVSVDEPDPGSRDRFGGTAAAPVFARIGQVIVNELDLRPTAGDTGCVGKRPAELGPSH
ncbi:MAG: peptidoglycan D,D-transpeptidase FtsI family protein [Ilumatobacteraceae bacterium]